jgi:hypothetical protein
MLTRGDRILGAAATTLGSLGLALLRGPAYVLWGAGLTAAGAALGTVFCFRAALHVQRSRDGRP